MIFADAYFRLPQTWPSLSPLAIFFYIFLLLVLLLSYPRKGRGFVLLSANLFFLYSFASYHVFSLLILTIFTYLWGLLLQKKPQNPWLLGSGVAVYVLALFLYKYGGIWGMNWLMPLGFSFVSFKAISYLADIYQQKISADKSFLLLANYILFFPAVTAGPIHRYQEFVQRLQSQEPLSYQERKLGAFEMFLGLFEKRVFCDFIASVVTRLSLPTLSGYNTLLAMVLYSFQIYLDFDAYSHIAIGAAKVLGFPFTKNFAQPYLAYNLRDFWRRWHISLGAFFRDYVYFPLGGSRKGLGRKYIAILVVFALSGIWHGSTLNFLLWGILHGVLRIVEERIEAHLPHHPLNILEKISLIGINFVIVTVLWQFFRFANFTQMWVSLQGIWSTQALDFTQAGITPNEGIWLALVIAFTCILDLFREKAEMLASYAKLPLWLRWAGYAVLVAAFMIFGVYGGEAEASDFIYRFF